MACGGGWGGGLWNRKEPMRAYPAVAMARCLLVAAAQLHLTCGVGGYVGIERKKSCYCQDADCLL